MRIEMNEEAALTTVVCALFLLAAICGLGGCHITERTKQKAMEAGLVEKHEASMSTTVWTKP